MNKQAGKDKTWQQTKSENTRRTILNATIQCIFERGYFSTTTDKVAREAGVSRGAMLHHFPSRFDLIKATVIHLHEQRLGLYEEQERQIQDNAEHSLIDEGIDAYWRQLHTPLFTVWHELRVAARTDTDLHNIMRPAANDFEENWSRVAASVFPDLALSDEFETANLLTMYLLEGMAVNGISRGKIAEKMIPWLKTELREMFVDVDGVDRTSASRRQQKPD